MNLRWSWDPRASALFRWVDREAWEQAGHDPVRTLGLTSPDRLRQLAEDQPFLSHLATLEADLERYLTEPRWYQARRVGDKLGQVAYFSPEFGVTETVPIYSGGLGVLAGDHLKAASDLGVPLVAIGLLYREGYFRQQLNSDGWQQEAYPAVDPHDMPFTLLANGDGSPLKIEVDLAGQRCASQLWRARVGRVDLILLDCDVEENDSEERAVTDRLYAGGSEHRLRQEIVLGIGGVRALRAAGYDADVWHSNEGHAGFLGLERIRELVERGLPFESALEAVRSATIFTTHTPVPAGIDVYEADLMEKYFSSFAKECGIGLPELMQLGRSPSETSPDRPSFNMAIMGFKLAGRANGVSKLHGAVSRSMFAPLWADVPEDEVPITSITNGVHTSTWLGPEISEILSRRLASGWAESADESWDRIGEVPNAELWRARDRARERLVYFVRQRLTAQLKARGASESEVAWADEVFDPGILTIGFARRFAKYKRATLMLTDPERLKGLLLSSDRPIQMVVAGKAHPRDDDGKELIRQLLHFSKDPELRGRFAFIEDYDMEVGRQLTQGVDVWLNNPRRPLEACGTSGMKAAMNGGLNLSILDGWWDECYDGTNGWAIGSREPFDDPERQDRVDSEALYGLLEREIIPRFYDRRSEGPAPRMWIERMKSSMSKIGRFVTADRMLRDYVEELYEPAAAHGRRMAAEDFARARELAAWKARVETAWPAVGILDVEGDVTAADIGDERSVRATVRLGDLAPSDVCVQLAHGRVGASGELEQPKMFELSAGECEGGVCTYSGSFSADRTGLYGMAVRVVPDHPELTHKLAMGLVAWA